ncbi:MAG: urease accessory protein UreF [Acidobacteria bacterium]|nr:MAG: urease accessory protein UreF [Acidobacteriota bacterium]
MNLLVWQLVDSSFPSGGFAHSGGLEASVHHGHVASGDAVRTFARQSLAQTGRGALPLVTAAHRQPGDLAGLDNLADVFLSNPVANRASRAQGRALLTSATRSFRHASFASIDEHVRGAQLAAHHAPMFGAVLNALGVGLPDTQRAFLFVALRGVASAAVRLGLIGGYQAQDIQMDLAREIDSVIRQCGEMDPGAIAQTAPLIDLFQSTHDRLYSRLFQS